MYGVKLTMFIFNDLIVLQNKVVRIVHGVSPRTNADKLYFDHDILSLKRLYSYNIGIFMYKFSKNMLPELFDNFFCNVASVHEHNTRSACLNHIYVKFKGTTICNGSVNEIINPLQWHHNGRNGVSNHQSHNCLLKCLFSHKERHNENITATRHWPLWGESTGNRWIPRTKGQWRGKCFYLMTSSSIMWLVFVWIASFQESSVRFWEEGGCQQVIFVITCSATILAW